MELYQRLQNWLRDDEGQGLVEYALIIVLISIAAIIIMGTVGGQIDTIFGQVSTALGS